LIYRSSLVIRTRSFTFVAQVLNDRVFVRRERAGRIEHIFPAQLRGEPMGDGHVGFRV